MNVFAMCFCFMLLVKGYIAPSSTDSGTTGNIVQDFFWVRIATICCQSIDRPFVVQEERLFLIHVLFYIFAQGMELYPRILGWDVKVFTNCRSGMMFWAVAIVSYCYKNMQLSASGQVQYGMLASVAIQLVYITKFFYWEMGYMCSMDIQHDRAGYYICWGCLVWVPAVYTSAAFYLTSRAPDISATTATAIFLAGVLCVWINYDSDRQRYQFRQSEGKSLIWGRVPRKIIAKYETSSGTTKTSLLLVDGWWKVSRHFHYVPEIMAAFFWSLPALDTGLVGPYFYVVYLTILLTDRAFRDDDRCRSKYGKYWDEYCLQVPYKIVPGIV
jgi:7-dehydrocholesterol reductase